MFYAVLTIANIRIYGDEMKTTSNTRNLPESSGILTKDLLQLANKVVVISADVQEEKPYFEIRDYLYNHHLLTELQNLIQYKFNKEELLIQALSHRSFCHEYPELGPESYERLEFLGDALLDFYISEKLFKQYPELNEGQLSKFRSSLVNRDTLFSIGVILKLENFILVGNGEFKNNGHARDGVVSDIVESLGAAIYLDSNIDKYNSFMDRIIQYYEKETNENFFNVSTFLDFDPKTKLQEVTMAKFKSLPEYNSLEIDNGNFESKLILNGKLISVGRGLSKREAEKDAAAKAICEKMFKE